MKIARLFFVIFLSAQFVQAQTSSSLVYTCNFADAVGENEYLRMKEYFDSDQNLELGKVEHFKNSQILESRLAKIYQIPLWQQQAYLKIWDAKDLRVDAQMSSAGNNSTFYASFSFSSSSRKVFCTRLY